MIFFQIYIFFPKYFWTKMKIDDKGTNIEMFYYYL